MSRGAFLFALLLAGCVGTPEIPPEVRKETHRVKASGESVAVDFYFRPGPSPRPLALVVHGFLANKERMAHWGLVLAREGFIVAVPNNPTYANDDCNTAAIVALLQNGHAGQWPISAVPDGRAVLVGFSRGGFETILAAAELGDRIESLGLARHPDSTRSIATRKDKQQQRKSACPVWPCWPSRSLSTPTATPEPYLMPTPDRSKSSPFPVPATSTQSRRVAEGNFPSSRAA